MWQKGVYTDKNENLFYCLFIYLFFDNVLGEKNGESGELANEKSDIKYAFKLFLINFYEISNVTIKNLLKHN